MSDKADKETTDNDSYSVSSGKTRKTSSANSNKTISITVPGFNVKKPDINKAKNIARSSKKALVVVVLIVALIGGYSGSWLENKDNNGNVTFANLSNQEKIVTSQSQLINQIAKTVGPSVVSVNVDVSSDSNNSTSGFGLFGFSQPEEEEQAGTGIILTSSGLIITNRHVVPDGTTNVSVTLSNGTELKNVSVVGRTNEDDSLDIAFLKINNTDGQKLTPAVLGNSSEVQVGDSVVAIGNALGQFQNTVTSGIISGYGRSVEASDSTGTSSENLDDLFQTDAAINEGNSGGPLVNLNGEVIGINTATADDAQNIGFAIPVNDTKGLIEQVIKTGKFSVPYLGIRYIPLTPDVADEYNLSVSNGAFIAPSDDSSAPSIISGSPAANAGLQENDIITAVNNVNINQSNSLTSLLDQYVPGNKVTLTVIRGNSTKQISVTLGTTPSS